MARAARRCTTTFPTLEAAKDAAINTRARRALKGRTSGGTTIRTHYCPRCDGWHNTNTKGKR